MTMANWRLAQPGEMCGALVSAWGPNKPTRHCVRKAHYAREGELFCWQHAPYFDRRKDRVVGRTVIVEMPFGTVEYEADVPRVEGGPGVQVQCEAAE